MKTINQRLNNISGQIEGIKKMIERGDDCIKLITQLKATKSAISGVMDQIVDEQFNKCLKSVKANDKKLLIKINKYVKSN